MALVASAYYSLGLILAFCFALFVGLIKTFPVAGVLFAGVYAFVCYCLMKISWKASVGQSWEAWVPVWNVFLMCRIAKLPAWVGLVFLFVPVLQIAAAYIILRGLAESAGRDGNYGIVLMIPLWNLFALWSLAFQDAEKNSPSGSGATSAGVKTGVSSWFESFPVKPVVVYVLLVVFIAFSAPGITRGFSAAFSRKPEVSKSEEKPAQKAAVETKPTTAPSPIASSPVVKSAKKETPKPTGVLDGEFVSYMEACEKNNGLANSPIKIYSPDKKWAVVVERKQESFKNMSGSSVVFKLVNTQSGAEEIIYRGKNSYEDWTGVKDWSENSEFIICSTESPEGGDSFIYSTTQKKIIADSIEGKALGWIDGKLVLSGRFRFFVYDMTTKTSKKLESMPSGNLKTYALVSSTDLKRTLADVEKKRVKPSPSPVADGCSASPKICVEEYYRNVSTNNHKASYLLESRKYRAETSYNEWFNRYWKGVVSDEVIWSNEEFNDGNNARVKVEVRKTWNNPATVRVEVKNYVGTVRLIRENGVWFTDEFDFVSKDVYQAKQAEQSKKEKERQIREVLKSVDTQLSFYEVMKNPAKYEGKTVHWTGSVSSINEKGNKVEMFIRYENLPGEPTTDNFYAEGELDHSNGLIKDSRVEIIGVITGTEIGVNLAGVEFEVPKLRIMWIRWE